MGKVINTFVSSGILGDSVVLIENEFATIENYRYSIKAE